MICEICSKEFFNLKSLTNHKRWHPLPKYKKFQENIKLKAKLSHLGIKNPMWKGDLVGYVSLHDWIKYHKQKSNCCENCKKNMPLDLANISGEYKRDIDDFEWLCRKCHMNKDGRIYNLRGQKR